jgi:hypothetical protein
MEEDMNFSRDSASIEINKLLDPRQSKGPSQNRINTLETPSSHMMIPDERSYKNPVKTDESMKVRAANKDLDELLGLDHNSQQDFSKKHEPKHLHNYPSPMAIPDENSRINRLGAQDPMKPKMIHQVPSDHFNDSNYVQVMEENKRLKLALESFHKESHDPKGENPTVKIYMLQDQLAMAEKSLKELKTRNDELAGENEVPYCHLDAQ